MPNKRIHDSVSINQDILGLRGCGCTATHPHAPLFQAKFISVLYALFNANLHEYSGGDFIVLSKLSKLSCGNDCFYSHSRCQRY